MDNSFLKINRFKKALTFIEIMIACVLMSIVFFIGKAISNGFGGVKKVRNYETAISLANQAIEAIRAARSADIGASNGKDLKEKFDSITSHSNNHHGNKHTLISDFASDRDPFDRNLDGFVPIVEVNGITYKRTIKIENIKSSNKNIETGLKTIKVIVEWKAAEDGKPVTFEVVTAHCDLW